MASTYVNNLRLEEIGTGEQSGTWGDTTNTNLEIIGQAVAWGTRAIANASTDNITIADGALDADRCLGLKLTGGGQACTVSLLPNTSSKTWFMYNATAAALTFTCGSGANVIIPAGQTKVIATDGLGSGGVVHDLLTAVNLAGTTVVDDLTVSDDLTVGDDLAVTGLATIGETLAVTGVVTANAGVVVDNITIDGQEIDVSSGDLTLDVAGDILLNADGGDIFLADDSVTFGKLKNSSSHFFIQSLVADKDILIIGNDGGSEVTAVEFDMSAAGAATFNSTITAAGGSGTYNNTANVLTLNGSQHTRLLIDTSSSAGHQAGLTLESNGQLTNFANTGTNSTIANDIGNFTIDSAADIVFDAGGSDILLKASGTTFGSLRENSGNFRIKSEVADASMLFMGNDGGVEVTPLYFTMSDGGGAFFAQNVYIPSQLVHTGDGDTLFEFQGANSMRFKAGGNEVVEMDGNTVTFNDGGADYNFTIESTGNANMFYVDGGDDRVCIGTNASGLNLASALGSSSLTVADGILFGTSSGTTSYVGTGNTTGDLALVANAAPGNLGATRAVRILGGTSGGGGPNEIAFFNANDGSIFNPDRAAGGDFRVAGGSENHMLFVDASADHVMIAKSGGNASFGVSGFLVYKTGEVNTTRDDNNIIYMNRTTSDGNLVQFYQAGSLEGSISISGTTTSFNGFSGLHESSGIPTNTPVGTVVSTIDELDVYATMQGEEGDESPCPKAGQPRVDHAKVKVSDTSGDACVYGVVKLFNPQGKVNVTSVGIGSVRVTGACAKGDLLESNGDGTAKVQSDDIIRSKTIGKVTIGNSNTGVKLVSCVMYCG